MGVQRFIGKVRRIILVGISFSLLIYGCEEKSCYSGKLIGTWQLFKISGLSLGSVYVEREQMRIEEFTADFESISYNYQKEETGRRGYCAADGDLIIYGFDQDYNQIKFRFGYRIDIDTLRLRYDGGFEYYDEFFVLLR